MSMQQGQPEPVPSPSPEPSGIRGMFHDASTLASTGLLLAVFCAVVAGLINVIQDPGVGGMSARLLALTDTVDVGDVALLGIAVALLLLTPDPPGGVDRPLLLQFDSALAGVIAVFGLVRAIVLLVEDGTALSRFGGFLATLGFAIAAATVSYYAARESFLKEKADLEAV
jgi:hypothetical protein